MKKAIKITLLALFLLNIAVISYFLFIKSSENDAYVAYGETCTYINYVCGPGTEPFYDGIGCGCEVAKPVQNTPKNDEKYIGRGDECKYIEYVCEAGTESFSDNIGCGCK